MTTSQMLVLPVSQHIPPATLLTPTYLPQSWNLAEVCPEVPET